MIDHADAALAPKLEQLGLAVRVEQTLMKTPDVARELAEATLELCP